jgi:predicted RNA-binding Zn-ribbon protein involved in translation (DUF1610 family)
MSALVRWDGFLAQIEGRHREVRAEAEATARAAVAQLATGGDYLPLSHQLSGVEHRLQELESKIIDTWHAKVDDAICGEGHGEAVRTAARDKGHALQHALEDEREELIIRVMAELARARYQQAVAQHRPPPCSACGVGLDAPVSFRAIELRCAACGSVTIWQPPELMVTAGAIGTHAISQEAATVEWRAMRAAERAMHAIRPPRPLAPVKQSELAQIAYWRKYLAGRAWFEPELGRDPAMEIRRRMQAWYESHAEFEEAWVAAGRPREAV